MKDELEKHQASLKDSQALAEKLLSDSEDPVTAAELESRLSRADLELKQLPDKIEARENQLQAALAQCDQFEADSDDFLRWLTKTERTLAKLRPISADVGTVQEQKDSYQVGMSFGLNSSALLYFYSCTSSQRGFKESFSQDIPELVCSKN